MRLSVLYHSVLGMSFTTLSPIQNQVPARGPLVVPLPPTRVPLIRVPPTRVPPIRVPPTRVPLIRVPLILVMALVIPLTARAPLLPILVIPLTPPLLVILLMLPGVFPSERGRNALLTVDYLWISSVSPSLQFTSKGRR